MELFVDGLHNREIVYNSDDRHITVERSGTLAELSGGHSQGILAAASEIVDGYCVELALPWSNLGLTPGADLTLGFDAAFTEADAGGTPAHQAVWYGTANNDTDSRDFGNLVLLGPDAADNGSGSSSGVSCAGEGASVSSLLMLLALLAFATRSIRAG